MATTSPAPRERNVLRSFGSAVLILLAIACIAIGSITAWLRTQVLDTDQWTTTSREVIEDPAVQQAVAVWTVDKIFARVDAESALASLLPDRAQFLSGPLVSRLQVASYDVAEKALAQPAVQDVWVATNRRAHQRLVRAVQGDAPIIVEGPRGLHLDLRPMLERIAKQIGVSTSLVDAVPSRLTTVEPKNAEEIQRTITVLRFLDNWGAIITFFAIPLLAGGIWLARDRRRAWIWTGALTAVVAFAIGRASPHAGPMLADAMTSSITWKAAIVTTWGAVAELLQDSMRAGIVIGLLVMFVAWSTGPSAYLVRARRACAPVLVDHLPAVLVATGLVSWILFEVLPVFDHMRPGVEVVLVITAVGAMWTMSRIAARERAVLSATTNDDTSGEA